MRYSTDKDIDNLAVKAFRTGLVKPARGTKHWCMEKPDGNKFFIPGSPSDIKAFPNFRAALRRWLPEVFEDQRPSRPVLTLPVKPTVPKVVTELMHEHIADVRDYDVDLLQIETTSVDPEVTKANEPSPLEYLDALSIEEIEAMLAMRKARAQEAVEQQRKVWADELVQVRDDIQFAKVNLKALEDQEAELTQKLGIGKPVSSISHLPVPLFDRVLADPVYGPDERINVKATAEKHGVQYQRLMKEVKLRGLPRVGRGNYHARVQR